MSLRLCRLDITVFTIPDSYNLSSCASLSIASFICLCLFNFSFLWRPSALFSSQVATFVSLLYLSLLLCLPGLNFLIVLPNSANIYSGASLPSNPFSLNFFNASISWGFKSAMLRDYDSNSVTVLTVLGDGSISLPGCLGWGLVIFSINHNK